ncbi:hypothetical protein HDU85_001000 [Gaertneriomyces sp. JEL0708]|nr:hypothetical protein HDU85_001000 [Gaertneriomyces sp. JEL0708]
MLDSGTSTTCDGVWDVCILNGNPKCEGLSVEAVPVNSREDGMTDDCVYRVDTLVELIRDTENDNDFTCLAAQSPKGVCVAVGKQVHLLDADCLTHKATLTFESIPEALALNSTSSFLVVGDNIGAIHFVHIPTERVLFSRDLMSDPTNLNLNVKRAFRKMTFVARPGDEAEELIVVLENLVMLRFTNIHLDRLERAMEEGDLKTAHQLHQMIESEEVCLNPAEDHLQIVHDVVPMVTKGRRPGKILLCGSGKQPLTVWQRAKTNGSTIFMDAVEAILQSRSIVRGEVDSSQRYLLLLDCDGILTLWDAQQLVLLREFQGSCIEDFVILPNTDEMTIVALTASKDFTGRKVLQTIRIPQFLVTHRLDVANDVWLIRNNGHQRGDGRISFIECLTDRSRSKLYIRALMPAVPRFRFEQLLHLKRFEDAEEFARTYCLDLQLVSKAKLEHMLSHVARGVRNHENSATDPVDQILLQLRNLEDDEFALQYCLTARLATFEGTYRLLSYARSIVQDRLRQYGVSFSAQGDVPEQQKVHSAVRRFGTYQLVAYEKRNRSGYGLNGKGPTDFNSDDWQAFRICDLVHKLRELVRTGELKLAIVIWKRHCLDENLMGHVQEILAAMSEDASLNDFIPWLKTEVLPFVKSGADRLKLATWIQHRARLIERRDRRPHGALEVLRLLDSVASSGFPERTSNQSPQYTLATPSHYVENAVLFAHSGIASFGAESTSGKVWADDLKKHFEDLVYLWDEHQYCLSLNDYSQLTPMEISKELIDRVAASELLSDAIGKHFIPYIERHGLHFNEVLSEYCTELMDGSLNASSMNSMADSSWHARVLAILSCMNDIDLKADVVMELMKRTPVPWNNDADAIFTDSLRWITHRKEDLKEQYRLLRLKRMMLGYGISNFNISDKQLAKGLLPRILCCVEIPNAIHDALQVVSVYDHLHAVDAYRVRIMCLFEAGHIKRGLRLIQYCFEEVRPEINMVAQELGLDGEKEPDLVERIGLGKELVVCLVQIMEDAVMRHRNEEDKDVAETEFKWSSQAAVQLLSVLEIMNGQLATELNEAKTVKDSGNNVISNPYRNVLLTSAIMSPSVCWLPGGAQVLRSLTSLFDEFGVMLTPEEFDSEAERRKVLADFAKKVFKYVNNCDDIDAVESQSRKGKRKLIDLEGGTREYEQSHAGLYRLAQVLGFERSCLRGLLAEEAARNGDFSSASMLCKELFDKFPDAGTAQTVQKVARLLLEYAAEHKHVYRDARAFKTQFRLTARIAQLSAQAFSVCAKESIERCLDDWKNHDLQHMIFTQTDAGDYDEMVVHDLTTQRVVAFGEPPSEPRFGNYAGPSDEATGRSAPTPCLPQAPAVAANEEANFIHDRFGSYLFEENYRESSLVLSTDMAMELASAFVLDASPRSADAPLGLNTASKGKKAGKSESSRKHPTISGRILAEYLIKNKSYQTVLRVLHRAKEVVLRWEGSGDGNAWKLVVDVYDSSLKSLFLAVMASRAIDAHLALGYLLSLPQQLAFDAYKSGMNILTTDYTRTVQGANIGATWATAWHQRSIRITCEELASNAKWWHQLALFGIPFDKSKFRYRRETDGHQRAIVPQLLDKTGYDILTVLEFARCYEVPDDFVISEYVRGLILNADEMDYQNRVAGVVDDVKNKEKLLATLLEECLPRINPYDYERILFVIGVVLKLKPDHEIGTKCKEVVTVLCDYARSLPPTVEELLVAKRALVGVTVASQQESWEDLVALFPKSLQRLPFHPLINAPWSVIAAELTEESIPQLRHLRKVLSLNLDQFYVLALENMLREAMVDDNSNCVSTINIHFQDLKRLLSSITDGTIAIKALLHLAENFPCGQDRISAQKMALARAERAKDLSAANEIRRMLIISETELQLRTLRMEEMLPLINPDDNMSRLMHELYMRQSEVALDPKNDLDVHRLVDDIAGRTQVNVDHFRRYLLSKLLSEEIRISNEDREMYLPSMRVQINNVLNSRDELAVQMRVLYLLRAFPLQEAIRTLLEYIAQKHGVQTLNRIRALSVLFQLATSKDLARHGYEKLKTYMRVLLYLADFEELHIAQSLYEFEECDKEAFVKSLWVGYKDNIKVAQIICNICLDYKVYDLTLWGSALQRLIEKQAYRYLLGIMDHVSSVPELAQLNSLPRVWNDVLLGCLQIHANNRGNQHLLHHILNLVQKCPFLPELNVVAFVNYFTDMAMQTPITFDDLIASLKGIAALPPTGESENAVTKIVRRFDVSELVVSLDAISGSLDNWVAFPSADLWIGRVWVMRAIYDYIDEKRSYELLLTTRHLHGFVSYLVDCNKIQNLVVASVKAQRTAAACEVVQRYYQQYPEKLNVADNVMHPSKEAMLKVLLQL